MFGKKKKKEQVEMKSTALFILSEKEIPGISEFAANEGIFIQEEFTSIEAAKIALLLEASISKIVIIETGLGKFVSMGNRKELIDLLGMCNGVDKSAIVFYTNSVLKSGALSELGRKNKGIQWEKYNTTTQVLDKLKDTNEKFVTHTEQTHRKTEKLGLEYKGEIVKNTVDSNEEIVYSILDNIAKYNSGAELIQKF